MGGAPDDLAAATGKWSIGTACGRRSPTSRVARRRARAASSSGHREDVVDLARIGRPRVWVRRHADDRRDDEARRHGLDVVEACRARATSSGRRPISSCDSRSAVVDAVGVASARACRLGTRPGPGGAAATPRGAMKSEVDRVDAEQRDQHGGARLVLARERPSRSLLECPCELRRNEIDEHRDAARHSTRRRTGQRVFTSCRSAERPGRRRARRSSPSRAFSFAQTSRFKYCSSCIHSGPSTDDDEHAAPELRAGARAPRSSADGRRPLGPDRIVDETGASQAARSAARSASREPRNTRRRS